LANTISNAFVSEFKANVYQLSQQRGSRLGDKVRVESLAGNTYNFERLAKVAAQTKVSRHADTPVLDAPHSRRAVSPTDKEWGDLVDREDKLRLLISPESEYAVAGAMALGRAKDDLIIAAALGNATDGAGASVALPAGQKNALAASMTLVHLLNAQQLLNANDVYDEGRTLVYGSKQLRDVLQLAAVTSADYNVQRSLASGQVASFLALDWVRSERLTLTLTTRSCFMFQKMAMGLAINEDMFSFILQRPDKSGAWQVYCRMTMGATRIEDEGVVQMDTTET
jgi:hypothetical protein